MIESKNTEVRYPVFQLRLRELAKDYKNQTEFAKALGISRQTFGFYIRGERIPDIKAANNICKITGVSADWLMGKPGAPKYPNCTFQSDSFRERIEYLLQKKGLTAAKLAEETGISASLLSDLRRGTGREIGINTLKTLCKYFGVTSDYLLGLSDTPDRDPERRAASSYIGLSEEATYCLSMLASAQEGKLKPILERLIRHPYFSKMLECIANYVTSIVSFYDKEQPSIDEKDKAVIDDMTGSAITYYNAAFIALQRYLGSISYDPLLVAKE